MDLDVCDIDERKLLGAVLHTGHQGSGRIDGCKDRYAGLDGVSAVSYTHLDVYKRQISPCIWPAIS